LTQPRSSAVLVALALCALLAFAGFMALGIWQVERRAWKLDLIARIDQRVHAAPVAPPAADQWPRVNAADDAYRRVRIFGTFLHDRETLVQATTELGAGYWVMTPLRTADGSILLVNRGFVPPEAREHAARRSSETDGESMVTGLLRVTEPGGSFLRHNDPAANRWYSRDVQAIATARGLSDVAPFFVDAEAAPRRPDATTPDAPRAWPVGGLTVIRFPNNHLVYAFTWFALALMVAAAAGYVARDERRQRQRRMDEDRAHD
jgi:surfeit locus 1 family protein